MNLLLLLGTVLLLGLGNVAAVINVTGTLGKLVLFNANVPVGSYVQWNYNSAQVYVQPPIRCLNQFAGRCNLYENRSLSINYISYTDEGIYVLSVLPPESSIAISTSYQLRVYAPLSAPVLRSITSTPLINGTNVTLQCDAGNQNVTSYTFYRNGQKIICSGRVICRESFLDFTLIFESDSGSYTCTIENPVSANTSNSLSLTVYVPVSNVAVRSNVSGLVWPGLDSVSLRCSADGTNVSYSWSLQGAAISGGGRYILTDNNTTLIISPVSTNDNGSFICSATNITNSLNSSDVKFNLASPVSAVTLTSNTSAVLWAGEDSASLHCSAQGSAITFSWSLNGNQVLSKPPYSITQSDSPTNSTLTISPVSKTDTGPFTCTASNRANSITSRATNLNINSPLSAPVLRSITSTPLINGTDVTLQCDAGSQNVTSYFFYRNGQKIICSGRVICWGSFLDFTPIFESDSGSYTCTIENPVSANTSNSLSLTVYVPVSNVAVRSNVSGLVWPGLDSVSLRCSADGTNVSYSWSLQGAAISGGGRYILTDNNSTLIISPVSTNDNGSFICTATNIINSLNSRNVTFNLASPVSAVTLYSLISTGIWAGEDLAHFYCSAQGSAITFSWSLNGIQMSANPPYYINQGDSPPNSNFLISPVSKTDNGLITCKASNRANSLNSSSANLIINWSPDGKIVCTVQPINQTVQLGCSWPGGKPAANVTMIFGDVQNTSTNEVFRNVSSTSNIHGHSLSCNGNQLGRTSSCMVTLERPKSPDHKNDTVTPALVGGAVNLTVDLQAGVRSRASALSALVFPATFSWFQGNSAASIQTGGKFNVDSTPYASTLNIDKLTDVEFGEYKCVAENFIGRTTFLFNVCKVSQSGGGSSSGLNGGAIAGIVIVILAGVALIGVIAFFILQKRKTPKATYEDPNSPPVYLYETQLPGAVISKAPPIKEEANYQELTHGSKSVYHIMMPDPGR
ncbi:cell adhesion molecule CEACAM5-like isoform X2 [Ranitomeya variabilis]|uniref:cell adhesion molecule CEACAM5-like isoform X2 n=1 Tax=Ranitomeya variabilis TaxID=490064 RepID=UPI004057912A